MLTISIPWPSKTLSPNARVHWTKLSAARKSYRSHCGWSAKEQGVRPMSKPVRASVVFYPPDNRRRDLDNMLASIKSGIDGIADVIGVDDYAWSFEIRRGEPVKGGRVDITLSADVEMIEMRGTI